MNTKLEYKKTNVLISDMARAIVNWKQPSGQAEKDFYDEKEILEYNSLVTIIEGILRKHRLLNFIKNNIE
jgi:hypothetical protein